MTGKKNVSLPCAVGSTSYIDTVKNSYYVDKTLLIRDLIDDHAAVTLFTRPRRFGKTLAFLHHEFYLSLIFPLLKQSS